jgi:hypothetical protein
MGRDLASQFPLDPSDVSLGKAESGSGGPIWDLFSPAHAKNSAPLTS